MQRKHTSVHVHTVAAKRSGKGATITVPVTVSINHRVPARGHHAVLRPHFSSRRRQTAIPSRLFTASIAVACSHCSKRPTISPHPAGFTTNVRHTGARDVFTTEVGGLLGGGVRPLGVPTHHL